MAEYQAQDTDLVFALDIGTRSVVGVVGRTVGDRLKILGIEMEEHKSRAMMDGQIDNIQQVADLARIVTERLERQLEVHLEKVCVAAAGRALRTQSGTFALELPDGQAITPEQISQLETGAVSAAEAALPDGRGESPPVFSGGLYGCAIPPGPISLIHPAGAWR